MGLKLLHFCLHLHLHSLPLCLKVHLGGNHHHHHHHHHYHHHYHHHHHHDAGSVEPLPVLAASRKSGGRSAAEDKRRKKREIPVKYAMLCDSRNCFLHTRSKDGDTKRFLLKETSPTEQQSRAPCYHYVVSKFDYDFIT